LAGVVIPILISSNFCSMAQLWDNNIIFSEYIYVYPTWCVILLNFVAINTFASWPLGLPWWQWIHKERDFFTSRIIRTAPTIWILWWIISNYT
jgi:hypothetical protein